MTGASTSAAVGILAGVPLVYFVARYYLTPKPIPGIPHNPLDSILGDIPSITEFMKKGTGSRPWFMEQADKHGPIFQVLIGSWKRLVVVSDPHEIEDILRRHGDFEQDRLTNEAFRGVIPHGMIALQTTAEWKSHRRLMGPSMTNKYLIQMTPRMSKNIQRLVALWERKSSLVEATDPTATFEAASDLHLAAMDSIGDITFGEGFNGLQNSLDCIASMPTVQIDARSVAQFPAPTLALPRAMRLFLEGASNSARSPWPRMAWFFFRRRSDWKTAYSHVSRFLDERVKQAREKAAELRASGADIEAADCVLDMAIRREGKDGEPMPDAELRDELILYILGGQDTTASVISWGVKFLARHPDVQRKLRKALLEGLDDPEGRELTWDDVQGETVPYLDAVVAEVLRHSFTGGMVSRELKHDAVILSHALPKGTPVIMLTHHAGLNTTAATEEARAALDPHRSEASRASRQKLIPWADDGSAFDPERWIDEAGKYDAKRGWSMPFGGGQRGCFGQRLAMLQLKLLFASLSLAFFFDAVPEHLDTGKVIEAIIRHPADCFVRPRKWTSIDSM